MRNPLYLPKFIELLPVSPSLSLFLVLGSLVLEISTPGAWANINGSDQQNFNPALTARDYVTVSGAQTLQKGQWSLGLTGDYAVNTLPYFEDQANLDADDTSRDHNDQTTHMALGGAIGVMKNLELGLMATFMADQTARSQDFHGEFKEAGLTGLRLGAKLSLFQSRTFDLAAQLGAHVDTIKKNPYTQGSGQPSFAIDLIPEFKFSILRVATNLGYRVKPKGDDPESLEGTAPIEPAKEQFTGSLAVELPVTKKGVQLVGELYGADQNSSVSPLSKRSSDILEGLFGIRYRASQWIFDGGYGREIHHGQSTPDHRLYAGVRYQSQSSSRPLAPRTRLPAYRPKPSLPTRKPDQVVILSDILFRLNSAELDQRVALLQLKKVIDLVKGPRGLDYLVIEGHTCDLGTHAHNLNLSMRRALAVKRYLVSQAQLPNQKIKTVGFGEVRPLVANLNEASRKKNRRVTFKIYHARSPSYVKGSKTP